MDLRVCLCKFGVNVAQLTRTSNYELQCYWFDTHTGHYIVVSLGKTLYDNFLTDTFFVWKTNISVCFTTAFNREKN